MCVWWMLALPSVYLCVCICVSHCDLLVTAAASLLREEAPRAPQLLRRLDGTLAPRDTDPPAARAGEAGSDAVPADSEEGR